MQVFQNEFFKIRKKSTCNIKTFQKNQKENETLFGGATTSVHPKQFLWVFYLFIYFVCLFQEVHRSNSLHFESVFYMTSEMNSQILAQHLSMPVVNLPVWY